MLAPGAADEGRRDQAVRRRGTPAGRGRVPAALSSLLARNLGERGDEGEGARAGGRGEAAPVSRWRTHRDGCFALLDRDDRCETAGNALEAEGPDIVRLVDTRSGSGLRALAGPAPLGEE